MDNQSQWTEAYRQNFKRFWESDMGKDSKQILTDLKQGELDAALKEPTPERVAERVHRAAGIDEAIQYIQALTK